MHTAERRLTLAALLLLAAGLATWWLTNGSATSVAPGREPTVAGIEASASPPDPPASPTRDKAAIARDEAMPLAVEPKQQFPHEPVEDPEFAAGLPSTFPIVVTGKVKTQLGAPVPGAEVRLWVPGLSPMTTIATNGEFRFEVPWQTKLGAIRLDAWARGMSSSREQDRVADVFARGEAAVIRRDIVLNPGWTIRGRVLGETGPVTGAFATCWQLDGRRVGSMSWTDDEGYFVMPVPDGVEVDRILANHGAWGHGDAVVPKDRSGRAVEIGDVVLARTSTIGARVVTPSGTGLPDLPVFVTVQGLGPFHDRGGGSYLRTRTDAGGNFTANGMAAGELCVHFFGSMVDTPEEARPRLVDGDTMQTIVVDLARVLVDFEWRGAPVPPNVLEVEWRTPEGEWPGPSPPDHPGDRLVPRHSRWIVHAHFPGGQGAGEVQVDVGDRDTTHCTLRLQ